MPRYRYTGESPMISVPRDGGAWFPNYGDEVESDTPIDHPLLELVTTGSSLNHWENEGGRQQEDVTEADECLHPNYSPETGCLDCTDPDDSEETA